MYCEYGSQGLYYCTPGYYDAYFEVLCNCTRNEILQGINLTAKSWLSLVGLVVQHAPRAEIGSLVLPLHVAMRSLLLELWSAVRDADLEGKLYQTSSHLFLRACVADLFRSRTRLPLCEYWFHLRGIVGSSILFTFNTVNALLHSRVLQTRRGTVVDASVIINELFEVEPGCDSDVTISKMVTSRSLGLYEILVSIRMSV